MVCIQHVALLCTDCVVMHDGIVLLQGKDQAAAAAAAATASSQQASTWNRFLHHLSPSVLIPPAFLPY